MSDKKILQNFLDLKIDNALSDGIFKEREECLQIERMLTFHDIKTDYPFLLVTSGYSGIFHYHPQKFWVYDVTSFPTISSSLNAIGYDYSENRPQSIEQAFEFIKENIDNGKPVFQYWYEPLVIYGYDYSGAEKIVHWYNRPFGSTGVKWSENEFKELWWQQEHFRFQLALKEPMDKPEMPKIFDLCIRHTVEMAINDPINSTKNFEDVFSGFDAYDAFIADLNNMDLVFQKNNNMSEFGIARGWGCFAIYPQWTGRLAFARFLKEYGSCMNPTLMDPIKNAAEYYIKETSLWLEWEKCLGRNWSLLGSSDANSHDIDFNRRWNDQKIRSDGAAAVTEALDLEKKAINELQEYLKKSEQLSKSE